MSAWLTNPWRDLTTRSLLRELECRQWDLASVESNPDGWQFAPESRAFLVQTIRDINGELARRKALVGKPGAPAWPNQERDRKAELAEIKHRLNLVDLVNHEAGTGRGWERRGDHDVWCRCPLPGHDEKTPSFHINEKDQTFFCFGCQRGGDLFELARHLWSDSMFSRVADRLRGLAGLAPVVPVAPDQPKPPGVMRPDGSHYQLTVAARRQPTYRRG